jgi:hypothetical protein
MLRRRTGVGDDELHASCDIRVDRILTGALVVTVRGELTAGSAATLAMLIDPAENVMVYVDLIDVGVVDTEGMAALVALYRRRPRHLRLLATGPIVDGMLRAATSPGERFCWASVWLGEGVAAR